MLRWTVIFTRQSSVGRTPSIAISVHLNFLAHSLISLRMEPITARDLAGDHAALHVGLCREDPGQAGSRLMRGAGVACEKRFSLSGIEFLSPRGVEKTDDIERRESQKHPDL